MACTLASLNEEQLKEIRNLEEELGRPLLAFSCVDLRPASLDADSVRRIQKLEGDLGVALLAVQDTS